MSQRRRPFLTAAILLIAVGFLHANADPSRTEAMEAMNKAIRFFSEGASHEGAYVYRYSSDLMLREGEGKALTTTGWTEPPGTPAVGMAYLEAYQLTGAPSAMKAAKEAAYALVQSQLRSGGWDSSFELGEKQRMKHAYRTEPEEGKRKNVTTLDDNKSQACLMFLMRMDEELGFKDGRIHEAVDYALNHFLAAQYPNGAWPQRFVDPPDPKEHPILQARYPDEWSRTFPRKNYQGYYTFNDGTMSDMVDVLLEVHRIYGEKRFMDAARKTGDFILLAQMPAPQPGWAQQYNPRMEPAWARKFEPPSLSGGESQGVVQTLMTLYRATREEKYLEPIPRALAYYKRCLRPDGRLARFYELKTNKPLYFTKDYRLTYSDADMPTHYGFIVSSKLDRLEREYGKLVETPKERLGTVEQKRTYKLSSGLIRDTTKVIKAMDSRGAWVQKGTMQEYPEDKSTRAIIESRTFISNLRTLSRFIAASDQRN